MLPFRPVHVLKKTIQIWDHESIMRINLVCETEYTFRITLRKLFYFGVKSIDIEINLSRLKCFWPICFFKKKKKKKKQEQMRFYFLLIRNAGRIEGSTSSQINSDWRILISVAAAFNSFHSKGVWIDLK